MSEALPWALFIGSTLAGWIWSAYCRYKVALVEALLDELERDVDRYAQLYTDMLQRALRAEAALKESK